MIELKTYSYDEMLKLLNSKSMQSIKNKLSTYEIEYTLKGKGAAAKFTLTKLNNPFKTLCIHELGFAPQTDFNKLAIFLYEFFCADVGFEMMPQEMMEQTFRGNGFELSRKTIGKYLKKLEKMGIIDKGAEYVYYRVYKDGLGIQHHDIVEKQEYCKAWKSYYRMKDEGLDWFERFYTMYYEFGGTPRKQAIYEQNGIYTILINELCELTSEYVTDVFFKTVPNNNNSSNIVGNSSIKKLL